MIQAKSAYTGDNLRALADQTDAQAKTLKAEVEQRAEQILLQGQADADELYAQAADLRALAAALTPPPLEAKRTPLDGPPPPNGHQLQPGRPLEGAGT